jgi:N-acetylglucosaminyldiphosphoundecaprenol N-acetyl-beta-D-mannosaminyltransferase
LSTPLLQDRSYADAVGISAAITPERFETYDVAGVNVHAVRFEEGMSMLLAAPVRKKRIRVHFAAMHTFVAASRDEELRQTLNEADVIAPDGMPMVWLGRRQGKQVERFCGLDVMPAVLDRSRRLGFSHYFYGGRPEMVEALAASLQEQYPGLNVAGIYAPPFRPLTPGEQGEVVDMINKSGADYVWVGLGSPKQDHWLASFRPYLTASVLLAVGAAFDVQNGSVKRAPRWAQRSGLEWFFRLLSEPRRLFWRYTVTNLRFAGLLLSRSPRRAEVSR